MLSSNCKRGVDISESDGDFCFVGFFLLGAENRVIFTNVGEIALIKQTLIRALRREGKRERVERRWEGNPGHVDEQLYMK